MKSRPKYHPNSDNIDQLCKRLINGEVEALELIYTYYFNRLLCYGIQIAGPSAQGLVEDVIQEFFLWLAQHHLKVKKIKNFESYLFQSIRKNLFNKLKIKQDSQASLDRFLQKTTPLQDQFSRSPEQLFIDKAQLAHKRQLVQQELNKLPPYQKEILYLRFFEDKSYEEIADILSINQQVAYNYVFRALKRLKRQFADLVFSFLLSTFWFSF